MIETAWQSEEIADIANRVMNERSDLRWILDAGISIGFLESDKSKKKDGKLCLAECIKVRDLYKVYIPHDEVAERMAYSRSHIDRLHGYALLHFRPIVVSRKNFKDGAE